FVAAFPGNTDAYRGLNGLSTTAFGAGRQTYSEWTWGVSYKPVIPHVALLAFRPEIRWDKSFSGGHPYNALTNTGNFTLAADVILGF
ncbi:porin, partial [Acetobacteraceae bacterium]|nr:porin [Acetobacteraceae bacterium]